MKRTIKCKGKLIDLTYPKIMGIINLTPDSFYIKSQNKSEFQLLNKIEKMLLNGATFIDLGACSSRPGAVFIDENEERNRLIPMLTKAIKEFPEVLFSIDTFRSKIAQESIELGAAMINDISGGDNDNKMYSVVASYQTPYVLMHMRGNSQNMYCLNNYNDLINDIIYNLQSKVIKIQKMGLNDVLIDPGFGFAKNLDQNYKLMKNLKSFEILNCPILIGISRKSMVYKLLKVDPDNALNGSSVLHTFALINGASILRVHDVKEAAEVIKITNLLKK